jgi:hypothetical protein
MQCSIAGSSRVSMLARPAAAAAAAAAAPARTGVLLRDLPEMAKAGLIEEMMNDAIDSALGDEDIEEETDAEVEKVLLEVAGETLAALPAARARPVSNQQQPMMTAAAPLPVIAAAASHCRARQQAQLLSVLLSSSTSNILCIPTANSPAVLLRS